ncbi:MAG: FHA domain-containing protein, partial [Deltaproteobacteria bacterium]|nr:FHA domain-containing protein [Deltaproteobacteria bacterium]
MTSDGQPTRGAPHLRVAAPQPQGQQTQLFEYAVANLPSLLVLDGPLAGRQIPMAKKLLTIGRDAAADVVLPDLEVSTRHAEIVRGGQRFTLRDAGSKNGVEFRGQLIDEVPLADGDEFSICRSRFRFSAAHSQDDLLEKREHTEVVSTPAPPASRRAHRVFVLAAAA